MRILVVDDDEDVRRVCRVNLQFLGHTVMDADDGEEALQRVADWSPDLVILDVMMPRTDGLSVLAKLRGAPATRDVPVVLLSARVRLEDQLEGWDAGADDYVTKPFSTLDLARAVDRIGVMTVEERAAHRERNLGLLAHLWGRDDLGKPSVAS